MNQPVTTQPHWLRWLRQGNRPVVLALMIAIVAIMALAIVNQSPHRGMCALFDGYSITKNERHRILLALGTAGLEGYQVDKGRIMVPVNEQAKYLATISENNALPRVYEVEQEFQLSPFMPRSQQALLELDRRKKHICDMILRLPFVAEAWFEMDGAASGNMFQPHEHSAVVMIQPEVNSALTREQVESIQKLVSSAIVGIKREDVAVIDSNVGITYQDIRDVEQSRLIDFVNWKMNRQAHYHQLLTELAGEYPGIEIEVRVEPIGENGSPPLNDKIAVEKPDKLATHRIIEQPLDIEAGHVGLNSSASVVAAERRMADPPTQAGSSNVDQTSYQQTIEKLPTTVAALAGSKDQAARLPTNGKQSEAVRITARIPFELVASFQSPELDDKATAPEKFDFLKHQIIARIRHLIPAASLVQHHPISVLLMEAPENGDSEHESFAAAIKRYWPIGAILLLGLVSLFGSRSQPVPKSPSVAAASSPPAESQELHLQQQLSHLIDSDPATAAKVIKNWIRQGN